MIAWVLVYLLIGVGVAGIVASNRDQLFAAYDYFAERMPLDSYQYEHFDSVRRGLLVGTAVVWPLALLFYVVQFVRGDFAVEWEDDDNEEEAA